MARVVTPEMVGRIVTVSTSDLVRVGRLLGADKTVGLVGGSHVTFYFDGLPPLNVPANSVDEIKVA